MKKITLLFFIIGVIIFPGKSFSQVDSVYYHNGVFESQWGSSTGNDQFRLYVRFTPNTYPAQLKGIRAYFRNAAAGATFKWTVYTDVNGLAAGGVTSVYMSANALANPAAGGVTDSAYMAYIDLSASNLTITTGDFYCGVSEANNNGFLGLAIDNNPATNAYDNRQWQYLFGGWNTLVSQASSGQFGVTAIFNSLSMGVTENAINAITVSPDPVADQCTISLPSEMTDNGTLCIMNMQGQIVSEQKIYSSAMKVDMSALPSGMYFITAQNEKLTINGKLLRQ